MTLTFTADGTRMVFPGVASRKRCNARNHRLGAGTTEPLRATLYQRVCRIHDHSDRTFLTPSSRADVMAVSSEGANGLLPGSASSSQAQNNGPELYRSTGTGTDDTRGQRNPGNGTVVDPSVAATPWSNGVRVRIREVTKLRARFKRSLAITEESSARPRNAETPRDAAVRSMEVK
jgi:hypothetical protein